MARNETKFGRTKRERRLKDMVAGLKERIAEHKKLGQFQMMKEYQDDLVALEEVLKRLKDQDSLERHARLLADGVMNDPPGSYDMELIAKHVREALTGLDKQDSG